MDLAYDMISCRVFVIDVESKRYMISFIYCSAAINSLRKKMYNCFYLCGDRVCRIIDEIIWLRFLIEMASVVGSYSTGNIISICLHSFCALFTITLLGF